MGNGAMEKIAEIEASMMYPALSGANEVVNRDVHWLIAELRAALLRATNAERYLHGDKTIIEQLEAAETALTAARAALQRYGVHDAQCLHHAKQWHWQKRACDCGLDKALSTPGDAPNGGV